MTNDGSLSKVKHGNWLLDVAWFVGHQQFVSGSWFVMIFWLVDLLIGRSVC